MGRENLTIAYLHEAMAAAGIAVGSEAERHADAIHKYRDLLNPTRNRYLAQLDEDTVLNGQELGGHTEQQMYDFVELLKVCCDEIGRSFGAGPRVLSPNGAPGDMVTLIKMLENVVYLPLPQYR